MGAAGQPPRLFFSDAKLSFIFPHNWKLQDGFPFGPLFTKSTKAGRDAVITCAISAPLSELHLKDDVSADVLRDLARKELSDHQPGLQVVSDAEVQLAGHQAYDIVWDSSGTDHLRDETVYFFVENRVYALSLQADEKSFRWLRSDFHGWLGSLQILSRQDTGALAVPAHGGLWIHQTGGLKVRLSEPWLIAVADDRMLGATVLQRNNQSAFTATWDGTPVQKPEVSRQDKKTLLQAIRRKGYRLNSEGEVAFHGYPALQMAYEGPKGDRYIDAQDLLVVTPKGRWLLSFEADSALFTAMSAEYDQILKDLQFL